MKRHTKAAPCSDNTHCGVDITGGLPGRWHVGRCVPGGGTVLVNEGCILHRCSAREATGVVHVFCGLQKQEDKIRFLQYEHYQHFCGGTLNLLGVSQAGTDLNLQ